MSFIERTLHDPSRAQWGNYFDWTVVDNSDGSFSVGARYRAPNKLGAIVQAYTTCIVRRSGENIVLEKLTRM